MRAEQPKDQPITISYGVIQLQSGDFCALLQFNQATTQVGLNDAQIDAMIASLTDIKEKLLRHRAGAKP